MLQIRSLERHKSPNCRSNICRISKRKHLRNKFAVISWLLLTLQVIPSFAQVDLNLYHFDAIGQSILINPATPQSRSLVIGLPGASQIFTDFNSGVGSVDMFLLPSSPKGNALIENYLNESSIDAALVVRQRIDPLFLSFKTGRLYWSGGMSIRTNVFSRLPYALADLAYYGNASGSGRENVQLGNLGTEASSMISYHAGLQIEVIKDVLFVGGRVSYLNGLGIAELQRSSIQLQSNIDAYQINTNGRARVAFVDYESYSDQLNDLGNLTNPDFYTTPNTGFAYDLGVHYQVTEALSLSAAVTDMGGINWVDNATIFESQGSFLFEGINIDYTSDGQINTQEFLDSLLAVIDYTETQESFRSRLPQNYYFGAKYQLTKRHALAGLVHRQQFEEFGLNTFMLQYYGDINNNFQLMGAYRVSNETDLLSGVFSAGLSVRTLRTFQFYFLMNNIGAAFDPYGAQSIGFNLGFNLAFNPIDAEKKEKKKQKKAKSEKKKG